MTASEQDEFDEFYRSTHTRVVHLVYATTGDLGLAQDCAQEAYVRAWSQWRTVRACESPISWVRTVARRLAVSQWRKGTNRARAHERWGMPAPMPEPSPDRVAVLTALKALNPATRESLALHYLADLPVERIAAETGSPVGTIKARLSRGRTQLAALLAENPTTPVAPRTATPESETRHV